MYTFYFPSLFSLDILTLTNTCHSILSLFLIFFIMFTWPSSIFDGIVFLSTLFRQLKKGDIVECFKSLNRKERKGHFFGVMTLRTWGSE